MSDSAEEEDSDEDRRPPTTSAPPFSDQILENVLETVFQFISSAHDRNSCSLVSRSWHRTEAETREHLSIGNLYSINPTRALTRFHSIVSLSLKGRPRFADFGLVPAGWGAGFTAWARALVTGPCSGSIRKLVLKRITVVDSDLELIARGLNNFEDLTLICCDGFGTRGLGSFVENCKNLKVLDLIDNDFDDENEDGSGKITDWISKFPPSHTSLLSLSFDCVPYPVNFPALQSLIARSPNLYQLRVNSTVSIGQLKHLMLRARQLTHLGTGSFGGGETEVEVEEMEVLFESMKNLICLSGFSELSVNPEYLTSINPVCERLISLNLSYADISPNQLRPVITRCVNLQTLWALDTIGDEGLQLVAQACKNLRELRIFPFDPTEESEGSVSHIGLTAISQGCRNLKSILYFCQRMTNTAVISFSLNCPDLVIFRLCIMGRHIPDHTTGLPMDEGFGAIVKNCTRLKRLAVSGLLTDRAFELIGRYGKKVRTLSVAFGGDSDLGLKHVLEGCSSLKKLEIRDSPFGDAGLLSGIERFYDMRFVWINSCGLTVRGCREVARRLPNMVVEVIREAPSGGAGMEENEHVEKLYMYRSLDGPRDDAPPFVEIL
ncbi:hypothetical protein LUZ60_005710 [Juncus effusus]|nr:hypothetical protein LUZ60_005710 [Juncus effusus]